MIPLFPRDFLLRDQLSPNCVQFANITALRFTLISRNPIRALVIILLLTITASGCGGEPDRKYALGRSIEVHVGSPVVKSKMSFADELGNHRILRPQASNRQLAIVEVTIVNRTSTVMPLLVDEEAAQLGDRRGDRINAVDPFLSSKTIAEPDEHENEYIPLLWGEVQLDRGLQVKGWMVFDIPKGLTLGSLWWNEIDDVIVDYVDYFKRK